MPLDVISYAAAKKAQATAAARVPGDGSTVARARGNYLDIWGHSYAFGIGSTDLLKRFSSLVAEGLRLRESMEAVSGTSVASDSSAASWVKALQRVGRTGQGAVSGSITALGNRGFANPPGIYLLMYGINDLNVGGNSATSVGWISRSLEVMVSRFRSTAVFEDSDPTVTYAGSWATSTSTSTNSGAGFHYTTSNAATYAITTPADFPGGTIAIGIEAPAGAGAGGTHAVTYNGTAYTLDCHGRSGSSTGFVLRIPNVAPGVQTLSGAVSAVSNYTALDYWQHEAAGADAPLTVLVKQPYPTDYSLYGSVAPGPPTDAGVDLLNAALDALISTFDKRVLTVDTSVMNRDATMFAADKLHPSDKGHRTLAGLILAAVKNAMIIAVPGASTREPRIIHGTAAPTDNRTYYLVGDRMLNTTPAEAGTAGSKYVIDGWICSVEGRPGTWLAQRALTGN